MKIIKIVNPLLLLILLLPVSVNAQPISQIFEDIIIRVDTNTYSIKEHYLLHNNIDYLYFNYDIPDEVCEVSLYPARENEIDRIELIETHASVELALLSKI